MDIKLKNRRRILWLVMILISLLLAAGAFLCYEPIGKRVEQEAERYAAQEMDVYAWEDDELTARCLLESGYLFYGDFQQRLSGGDITIEEILLDEVYLDVIDFFRYFRTVAG